LGQSPDKTLNGTLADVRNKLRNDLDSDTGTGTEGFKTLMEYDQFSTRQFLAVLVFHFYQFCVVICQGEKMWN